ncbi:hypothetical protein [Lentzea flava]|uniref:hypothetical protein n=1 Tax=Lentzea flava TaxID=103732 RepID=UPI0020A4350D|nr:hypothetical protein [Lentzea flava]
MQRANDCRDCLTAFQDGIAAAIGSSEADWSGKAADQARTAVAGLGNKASEAGTAAQFAGKLIAQQSRALSTAKSTVPPPPAVPYDPAAANAGRMAITDPILYGQQAAADTAAEAAARGRCASGGDLRPHGGTDRGCPARVRARSSGAAVPASTRAAAAASDRHR